MQVNYRELLFPMVLWNILESKFRVEDGTASNVSNPHLRHLALACYRFSNQTLSQKCPSLSINSSITGLVESNISDCARYNGNCRNDQCDEEIMKITNKAGNEKYAA